MCKSCKVNSPLLQHQPEPLKPTVSNATVQVGDTHEADRTRLAINRTLRTRRAQDAANAWMAECQVMKSLVDGAKNASIRRAQIAQHAAVLAASKVAPTAPLRDEIPVPQTTTVPLCSDDRTAFDEDLMPLVLAWTDSTANSVLVCFEVDNWTNPIKMTQGMTVAGEKDDAVFTLTRLVPANQPAVFKFIVDGVWRTTPRYGTCRDSTGCHTNNVVMPVQIALTLTPSSNSFDHPKKVLLASSLTEWAQLSAMEFFSTQKRHVFRTMITRPIASSRMTIEFKFVVGGEWVLCHQFDTTTTADGFVNNLLTLACP